MLLVCRLSYCFFLFSLTACSFVKHNTALLVNKPAVALYPDSVQVRRVMLTDFLKSGERKIRSLTCYSEILSSRLQGVSCQNDLGFMVFSAGWQEENFYYEWHNPVFNKKKARLIMQLIEIDLFESYQVSSGYQIIKTSHETILKNQQGETLMKTSK